MAGPGVSELATVRGAELGGIGFDPARFDKSISCDIHLLHLHRGTHEVGTAWMAALVLQAKVAIFRARPVLYGRVGNLQAVRIAGVLVDHRQDELARFAILLINTSERILGRDMGAASASIHRTAFSARAGNVCRRSYGRRLGIPGIRTDQHA